MDEIEDAVERCRPGWCNTLDNNSFVQLVILPCCSAIADHGRMALFVSALLCSLYRTSNSNSAVLEPGNFINRCGSNCNGTVSVGWVKCVGSRRVEDVWLPPQRMPVGSDVSLERIHQIQHQFIREMIDFPEFCC